MITKLRLKNIQSHKRSIITLHKGVNIFCGQSDKGKTTIIRGIKWLVHNKPSGDSIRSWWGGTSEFEMEFDDGHSITRRKSDSENSYIVNSGKPLKAFGQGVPQQVTEILNLDEINLQMQQDSAFLLSSTSGEVASHFNKIAGIAIIDTSISNAKREVFTVKQNIEFLEAALTEKQEQYSNLPDFSSIENKVKEIEGKKAQLGKLTTDVRLLTPDIKRGKEIKKIIEDIDSFLVLETPIVKITKKESIIEQKKLELRKLNKLIGNYNSVENRINENNVFLSIEDSVAQLFLKIKKEAQFKRDLKGISSLVTQYTKLTKQLNENDKILHELTDKLPDVCPICNGTGKLK